MATKTKTVGKTTKTIQKGVHTTTIEKSLQQLMMDYNRYQEYKKVNNYNYIFASKLEIASFAKQLTTEELVTLVKVYAIQRKIYFRLSRYLRKQRYLDRVYGKEEINIMELSDEERDLINKKRSIKKEKAFQNLATKNTNRAINKALREEGYVLVDSAKVLAKLNEIKAAREATKEAEEGGDA